MNAASQQRDEVAMRLRQVAESIEQHPELDVEVHVFADYQEPLTRDILKLQLEYPYLNIQPRSGRSKLVLKTGVVR